MHWAGTFLRGVSSPQQTPEVIAERETARPSRLWHITPEVLEGLGKTKEAVEEFERSIGYPGDASGYNNPAYLYARRGEELDRAETLVDKAMRLEPRHNVYYMDTAGWVAFQKGHLPEAVWLGGQSSENEPKPGKRDCGEPLA